MNLILQAIKSLFRRVEYGITANVAALTKKIDTAQESADAAKDIAKQASSAEVRLDSDRVTRVLPVSKGGTGGLSAYLARQHLGIVCATAISVSSGQIKLSVTVPDVHHSSIGSILYVRNTSASLTGSYSYLVVDGTKYLVKNPDGTEITNVPAGILLFIKFDNYYYMMS